MLEWNVWRAMTMIDGGLIKENMKFDDFGKPLSTAQGNLSDIVCDYEDFDVIVEVTTATGRESFCLFVAPKINPTCVAYFYVLCKHPLDIYGGKSVIVPMDLRVFEKMLDDSIVHLLAGDGGKGP